MIEKLEKLKGKIMDGTTTTKDIDTINEVIKAIEQREKVFQAAGPELNESLEELAVPVVVNIDTVNIFCAEGK